MDNTGRIQRANTRQRVRCRVIANDDVTARLRSLVSAVVSLNRPSGYATMITEGVAPHGMFSGSEKEAVMAALWFAHAYPVHRGADIAPG